MPNLPPRTIVALGQCFCCGTEVKIKLNKNGLAYYFCPGINRDTGNHCAAAVKYGRDETQRMQREFLEARKRLKEPADEHPAPGIRDLPDEIEDDGSELEPAGSGSGGWGLGDY